MPADGYSEWLTGGGCNRPIASRLAGGRPFAIAALGERKAARR